MTLAAAAALSLLWTQRLVALAIALQSLELLVVRRACADDGIWRYGILAGELRALPVLVRGLFLALSPYRAFVALLVARLAASGLLGLGHGGAAPFLLLSQLALCVRFRGTYNGGSDAMTVVVLTGLSVAALSGSPRGDQAGLAYIAVQLTLSYFVAGVIKLKEPDWHTGRALRAFAVSPVYAAPAWLSRLFASDARGLVPSWLVMLFEALFPLAWLSPRAALPLLGAAFVFHVGTVLMFGLNRFLFAWASAYPAMWFASQLLGAAP